MNSFVCGLIALSLCASAASATPLPKRNGPPPEDLGRLSAATRETITATVALQLQNEGKLQGLVADLYDRSGANFRHFLSGAEFRARFGPSPVQVARIERDLRASGLQVAVGSGAYLRVTGSPAAMEKAFGVELHQFRMQGEGGEEIRFHAPSAPATVRPEWEGTVRGIIGLDDRPRMHPHLTRARVQPKQVSPDASAPQTDNPPGLWTVNDFAEYYNAKPLYSAGVTGKSQTIGVVTFASFTPSDVFAYWSAAGLKVSATRLKVVNVDKGPGAPSDASGSDETTLDVEQSGGIAPGAKLIVYQAPNTDQGTVDAFAAAVLDNSADAVTTSWGYFEEFYDDGSKIKSPYGGKADIINVLHDLFLQAACQGQSMFAAAGDQGALDANEYPYLLPNYSPTLSVDFPASDPYITAAGGTTLPGEQDYCLDSACQQIYPVVIKQERAWSWDYLNGLCATLGFDPVSCGIYPVGGGGGVSVMFDRPWYQDDLAGIAISAKGQALVDETQTPPQTLITLPAHFAGRNVPDISFNADPDTGYALLYTSDQTGFGETDFYGGTSFVAPQLAGVTALVNNAAGGRVGFLNAPTYSLAHLGWLYGGKNAPARDITKGNNDGYDAAPGYDQASGLGVLDVTNFAALYR